INDSLGHHAGDELLVAVTERLRFCLRAGDTVARLGGDEFTILLDNIAGEPQAIRLAERIAERLTQPIMVQGHSMIVTASIGIALNTGSDDQPGELLRNADIAMYQAKTRGKSGYAVFDRSMKAQAVERMELESELRRAIEEGELRVHYQPIVHLATGVIREVEALVRWEHPQRGLIAPDKFIPLAEETGLILPLGRWVLREACRQVREWQQQSVGDSALVVGVNISARQLREPGLIREVRQALQETGLDPTTLKLEITETVLMADAGEAVARLSSLKELGVQIAVDDFGTGYSSMAYLSQLPIDTLKIDRAFISKLSETDGVAIVQAVITLAHSLKLRVTSEGIETLQQWEQLRLLESDYGQGYYFARPLKADMMPALLTTARFTAPTPSLLS
ncbi:MAG: bifunctional diguanylate cyclase/phosphodiesterase, partial [Armatimonadota bacterium]|nr:bifunctional diguanylate cyclase/phosphodiesterase [Armatimonadota bacterium]